MHSQARGHDKLSWKLDKAPSLPSPRHIIRQVSDLFTTPSSTNTHTHIPSLATLEVISIDSQARTLGMEGAVLLSNEPVDVQTMLVSLEWLVVPDWGSCWVQQCHWCVPECRQRNSPQTSCWTEWNRHQHKVLNSHKHYSRCCTFVHIQPEQVGSLWRKERKLICGRLRRDVPIMQYFFVIQEQSKTFVIFLT